MKSLLQDYNFENGISLILEDFSLENIEELDVIVSDYKLDQFINLIQKTKMKKNKLKDIEKIFTT